MQNALFWTQHCCVKIKIVYNGESKEFINKIFFGTTHSESVQNKPENCWGNFQRNLNRLVSHTVSSKITLLNKLYILYRCMLRYLSVKTLFRSSRVITFRFDGRTQWQMFLSLAHLAPTWRLHTKPYKFGWNIFPNNARLNNRPDLNLGEIVYISIIFHVPVYWPDL